MASIIVVAVAVAAATADRPLTVARQRDKCDAIVDPRLK